MKNLIDTLQNSRDYTVAVQVGDSTAEYIWDYKLVGEERKELRLIYGDVVDGISVEEAVTAGELCDYLSDEIEPGVDIDTYSESTNEEFTAIKSYKKQKLLVFYSK